MSEWEAWRQDDNGNQYLVAAYPEPVDALAATLVLGARGHKQTYWVRPTPPKTLTSRQLYLLTGDVADDCSDSGRELADFLRALRLVAMPLRSTSLIDPVTFAALLVAAVQADAPAEDWRTVDLALDGRTGWERFDRVVRSQIADLVELAEAAPSEAEVYFGYDLPRTVRRSCGRRWYNASVSGYLEAAVAGEFGGWEPDDGTRKPTEPLDPAPVPEELTLPNLSWDDITDFLATGQEYE